MRPAMEEIPSSTPPKLSLFSLPRKPVERPGLLTPPLHHSTISVPFQWEEAPGKPKARPFSIEQKPKFARSLDLPPKLFSDTKVAHFPSPTTILDEPITSLDLSSTLSLRFPDTWAEAEAETETETKENKGVNDKYFGSKRWGSFRRNKKVRKGSFDSSLSDRRGGGGGGGGNGSGGGDTETKVKITRFKSSRSILGSISHSKSHIVASIYESFKQVIPWKRKQDQMRKVS